MTARFTSGPWNIHPHYPLDTEVRTTTPSLDCPEPFDYWRGTIAQGNIILAEAYMQTSTNGGWPHVEDVEEARANTLLITAAPELYLAALAAVVMLTGGIETRKGYEYQAQDVGETLATLRAALAKAKSKEAR